MPQLTHDITSYFIQTERDLYYLGPKDVDALPSPLDDDFAGYEQWQRDLEAWSARHLPGVETFPLAPTGWLEGAPPFLGLTISPEQVRAFSAEHEYEGGESRDPLVQMYAMRFSTWRAKIERFMPRLERTRPGRETMFWVTPRGIVTAHIHPGDWCEPSAEAAELDESGLCYWSPRVVWYLARDIEPAWADIPDDAFPSGRFVQENEAPFTTIHAHAKPGWFGVAENLAQVCEWFGIQSSTVKVEEADWW